MNHKTDTELDQQPLTERYGYLVSYALPCEGISLRSFLYHARDESRFYWESSREHIAFAGMGSAVEITGIGPNRFHQVESQITELFQHVVLLNKDADPLTTPRIFGGFAFHEDHLPDHVWTGFEAAYFVLPHYQLVSIHGEKWLTINVQLPLDESVDSIRAELEIALRERIEFLQSVEADVQNLEQARATRKYFPMDFNTWENNLNAATQRMQNGELKKTVLARICELSFNEAINLDSSLHYLAQHYAECYRFLFEPQAQHGFWGATPELLASVTGAKIETMALAGSIKRGQTPAEDQNYEEILLNDPKERYEHQLVIDQIQANLTPITNELTVHPTGVYKLQNIQHIYTPIEGKLKNPRGILPLVEKLHPTPALGGEPRDKAMQAIADYEPFPRGWYAAPIGWIDYKMDGQFTVAIRSAVAQANRAWLYAGVGIVADSQPAKEWQETALKFRPIMEALGVADDES